MFTILPDTVSEEVSNEQLQQLHRVLLTFPGQRMIYYQSEVINPNDAFGFSHFEKEELPGEDVSLGIATGFQHAFLMGYERAFYCSAYAELDRSTFHQINSELDQFDLVIMIGSALQAVAIQVNSFEGHINALKVGEGDVLLDLLNYCSDHGIRWRILNQ